VRYLHIHCSARRTIIKKAVQLEAIMYCPECTVEYREGLSQCPDCGVSLLPGAPPPGDPNLELMAVFEGGDPITFALAKGFLEDAGIPFFIRADEHSGHTPAFSSPFLSRTIVVGADRLAEARAILEQLTDPPPPLRDPESMQS
jgi:Putative prokaryotic signal transducing protein